ncbi:MAG TPA: zinc-binding dehydrogenase [Chloroflexota bacterium]
MAASTTPAMVLEAPERLRLHEFARPRVGPDEALLEVELAGICGTDVKTFHGSLPYPTPLIMGHEILGHVAEIGERAAEHWGVQVGDRVGVEGSVPCWACLRCQTGRYRFCQRKQGYGTSTPSTEPPHLWGAYGRLMYLAPGSILHRIAPNVPPGAAVVASNIANGIQWVRNQGGARSGDAVVVQGVGPQGLAAVVVARECGARLVVATGIGRDRERLELARLFGADHAVDVDTQDPVALVRELTNGEMADVVVDVSGSPRGLATSLELAREQGTVVCAGLTGKDTLTPLLFDQVIWKELRLQGVFTKGADAIAEGIRLAEAGKYPLERMLTHTFPLDQAEQAIRALAGEIPGLYPVKAAIAP